MWSHNFAYAVEDVPSYNNFGHQETSDGKTVTGSYRVALPDDRTQIVTYRATLQLMLYKKSRRRVLFTSNPLFLKNRQCLILEHMFFIETKLGIDIFIPSRIGLIDLIFGSVGGGRSLVGSGSGIYRSLVGSGSGIDRSLISSRSRVGRSRVCGGLVGRSGVSGGLVGRSGVLGVLGHALVLDVGDVAGVVAGRVGDDLHAAVGQSNAVRSAHDLSVTGLLLAVAVVRRTVLDGPRKGVRVSGLLQRKKISLY